jgi:hypothetical protein
MRRMGVISVLAIALIAFAAPAFAGVGLHVGLSLSPDDFLVGLNFHSKPVAPNMVLVPSVEAGFGDNTMFAGNLDLHYYFKTSSDLAPYAGGGITLNWFDNGAAESETDFGGSLLGGISLSAKYFLEAKLGLGDTPDWKIFVGAHMP